MKVWSAALCIVLLCVAGRTHAAGVAVSTAVLPTAVLPTAVQYPVGLLACPTTVDRIGRIIVPVMIDGTGPYRFLVDTGANHSMISPALAARLGLHPHRGALEKVTGITGTQQLPWIPIAELQVGSFQIANLRIPITASPVMDGLDGILGLAGLPAERIAVDFRHNVVWIGRSNGGGAWGYLAIPARRTAGGLLRVDARIGSVPVVAVIDTGSPRTLGNEALRRALLRSAAHPPDTARIFGVTRQVSFGNISGSPTVYLGPAAIGHLNIVYGNLPIFKVWHLEHQPAVVIGMDVLGTVDALILDYRRAHVYIMPYHRSGVEVMQTDALGSMIDGGGP